MHELLEAFYGSSESILLKKIMTYNRKQFLQKVPP